jgi:hypothetical protein
LPATANDPESISEIAALSQALQESGWHDGPNIHIEFRWGAGDAEQYRKIAAELVAPARDVVVALGTLLRGGGCSPSQTRLPGKFPSKREKSGICAEKFPVQVEPPTNLSCTPVV